MPLQHFIHLSRQRRIVLADHRKVIADHRNDLQSADEQVLPTQGVIEGADSLFCICRVRPEQNSPAVQGVRTVRLHDVSKQSIQQSPGKRHPLLVEHVGKFV